MGENAHKTLLIGFQWSLETNVYNKMTVNRFNAPATINEMLCACVCLYQKNAAERNTMKSVRIEVHVSCGVSSFRLTLSSFFSL